VLSEDSSFCANCGREVHENPATVKPSYAKPRREGNFTSTLVTSGEYLWPKITLVMFIAVPIVGIFGLSIMSGIVLSSTTNAAALEIFKIIAIVVGLFTLFSSVIAYLAFKKLLEQK
jgi:hypothetical protein